MSRGALAADGGRSGYIGDDDPVATVDAIPELSERDPILRANAERLLAAPDPIGLALATAMYSALG